MSFSINLMSKMEQLTVSLHFELLRKSLPVFHKTDENEKFIENTAKPNFPFTSSSAHYHVGRKPEEIIDFKKIIHLTSRLRSIRVYY